MRTSFMNSSLACSSVRPEVSRSCSRSCSLTCSASACSASRSDSFCFNRSSACSSLDSVLAIFRASCPERHRACRAGPGWIDLSPGFGDLLVDLLPALGGPFLGLQLDTLLGGLGLSGRGLGDLLGLALRLPEGGAGEDPEQHPGQKATRDDPATTAMPACKALTSANKRAYIATPHGSRPALRSARRLRE